MAYKLKPNSLRVSPNGFLTSEQLTSQEYTDLVSGDATLAGTATQETSALSERIDKLAGVYANGLAVNSWEWFCDLVEFSREAMGLAPHYWLLNSYQYQMKMDPLRADFIEDTLRFVLEDGYRRKYDILTWRELIVGTPSTPSVAPSAEDNFRYLRDNVVGAFARHGSLDKGADFIAKWVNLSTAGTNARANKAPDILYSLQILFGH